MNEKKLTAAGRLWIEIDGENFLGSGRIELLENIESLGSLRQAAASMGLSYRKAYYAVRSMNELAPAPLVELRQGGKGGGCAMLTETGRVFVEKYQKIAHQFVIFLTKQSAVF
ncbi:MAG: LysR family transcriptional regulator [Bacteroidetes bacterium]|nr:LysR family transcriptional regulator [Bacteroidota bacterium]